MLLTIAILFIVAVIFFRILRPLFWVVVGLIGVGVLITHVDIRNSSIASLKPVVQLVGHIAERSLRNGIRQYARWGRQLVRHV